MLQKCLWAEGGSRGQAGGGWTRCLGLAALSGWRPRAAPREGGAHQLSAASSCLAWEADLSPSCSVVPKPPSRGMDVILGQDRATCSSTSNPSFLPHLPPSFCFCLTDLTVPKAGECEAQRRVSGSKSHMTWLRVFNPLNQYFLFLTKAGTGLPGGTGQCRRHKGCWFNPWMGGSPGGGHGNPLQFSCLENPMDRGAWRTVFLGCG